MQYKYSLEAVLKNAVILTQAPTPLAVAPTAPGSPIAISRFSVEYICFTLLLIIILQRVSAAIWREPGKVVRWALILKVIHKHF